MSVHDRREGGPLAARTVRIEFPKPDQFLNLNDRLHWSTRAKRNKVWRDAAYWAAVQRLGADRRLVRSLVQVMLPATTRGRRDPHNFVATVKPIVDGLVTAGCWPDDNSEWVRTFEPQFYLDERRSGVVLVVCSPWNEDVVHPAGRG